MSPSLSVDSEALLAVAMEAARHAGILALQLWPQPRTLADKGERDFVTDADLAAQTSITSLIRARWPEHGYLAEEADPGLPASGPVIWVIDPIDGTSNYNRHQPNFAISVAAALPTGSLLAGAIYDPVRDELFSAAAGRGAWLNGQRLQASRVSDPSLSIIGFEWSRQPSPQAFVLDLVNRVAPQVHSVRAIGSAALALAWVAAGRLDMYANPGLKAWDGAVGALLVRQAGGEMRNLAGSPWSLTDRGCLAGNGLLWSLFPQLQ